MNLRSLASGIVATLAVSTGFAQAQDRTTAELTVQPVVDGIYMLTGAGGNIGVSVGEDALILVDDKYEDMSPRVQEALAKLSPKPARFVINTHWHGDHTGGNESLSKAGSVIVAHENTRRRMSEEQFSRLFDRTTPPSPKGALPVVTFTSDVTLHFNGEEMHVFHVDNAHTDGDGLVHFRKANVIHMGDTFFNGFYPFIDTSSGGTTDGMMRAADRVLAMANAETRIIPGHGPLARRADLQKFRDMLATIRGRVAVLVKEGKSMDETVAAKPTQDLDPVWGKGYFTPEQIVKMVYMDLSQNKQQP